MSYAGFVTGTGASGAACFGIPIIGAITITQAGSYCVAANIDAVTPITIATDNVTVNLNGYTLTGTNGIVINNNLSNITITNGTLATTVVGVNCGTSTSQLILTGLTIDGAATGITGTSVTSGTIISCTITGGTSGIVLVTSQSVAITNCLVTAPDEKGIYLNACQECSVTDCTVDDTGTDNGATSNSTISGILANGGSANMIFACRVSGTTSAGTDAPSFAAGIALQTTETNTTVDSCVVTASSIADGSAGDAYGIYLVSNAPENNIIRNCTLYANTSDDELLGIGLSGSSATNVIITNISYNNPTNYENVTNIFDPNTETAPSLLQNVSLYNGDL